MQVIILILTVVFFAMNMGGSGIAPSFAAIYGAKLISRKKAIILFTIFVILGALAFGGRVAHTLSSGLIAQELYTPKVALFILLSAAVSLFMANLLKVPQSTSWVTVAAVLGAALNFNDLNWQTVFRMIGMWLILPLTAFILTYIFFKLIYPPRKNNFLFYEKAHSWKRPIQRLALISSCYVAFAIGANNVANAVGPLSGANLITPLVGLLAISPFFGVGAWAIKDRTLKTIGKEIVPLGLITSTLVSFITASLLIFASVLGFPQSLVQLNALAIMSVGSIKHEHIFAARENAVKKTFMVWLIAPLISVWLSFLLIKFF